MRKIKTTVYISSHDYARYLQQAIESVLRQTVNNWELLLINDGSTDNTRDLMELYRGDSRIKIFEVPNIGLPGVANFALKNSRGEYIMRLDADDVLDENILLVLSNYLEKFPDIALVFPDYFLIDDHDGIIRYESRQSIYHSNHLLDMPANGASTMIRKKVLESLGGYREDLGAQDGFDLWTKILHRHKCANVNIPLFYYRKHGNNLTENKVRILSARRTIKKDACTVKLDEYRPIIAVIPCRRYYDIYSNLWSKKLNGKTLLDMAMEACMHSSIFDKIVVTSDTKAVQKNMSKYKDSRLCFIERNRESTLFSRSIVYTLEHIIKILGIGWNGTSVLSYIQAPFTTTASLEESVNTLILNNSDSAFSVEEIEEYLYKRTPHGLTPINFQEKMRSDFDMVYASTPTSTATRNINLKTGSLMGAKISYFIVPKEEAFFIRAKRDYDIARILSRNLQHRTKE